MVKQKNRNNPETLFNIHKFNSESLSILEIQFLDEIRRWESNEEEPMEKGEFMTRYTKFFKKY